MSPTFNCPKCGAPLEYDGGLDLTVECPYCKSSAIVPEELRGGWVRAGALGEGTGLAGALGEIVQLAGPLGEIARLARSGKKIEAVKLYRQRFNVGLQEAKDAVDRIERGEPVTMTNVTVERITGGEPVVVTDVKAQPLALASAAVEERRRKRIGLTIAILTFIIIIATILVLSWLGQILPSTPIPSSVPTLPGHASVALQFGGEGIGPGHSQEARSIAVDGAGHIYVAEYVGGRVQVFDTTGTFITHSQALGKPVKVEIGAKPPMGRYLASHPLVG